MSLLQRARPRFSVTALSARQRSRLMLVALAALALVAALVLQQLAQSRATAAQDDALRRAWSQRPPATAPKLDVNTVFSRFGIRQTAGSNELNWKVATASELRNSLSALDTAGVPLTVVKLTRDGAGFSISAERAP